MKWREQGSQVTDILREGDHPMLSFVVLDGLIGSTKMTGDGKRQITSFFFPATFPTFMDCTCLSWTAPLRL
ncbi:hypothetical protein NKH55_25110 [Mesorhizobium opportunistum]|uniref:hypothetical protein n=1 Tax=Mesorhizobium opportunistum TaxID=593909 RepID=UPI003336A73B